MPKGVYSGNKDHLRILSQDKIGAHLFDKTKLKISLQKNK